MASLVTHAIVGAALGQAATGELRKRRSFWALAVLAAVLPDFDVIGFAAGVPYGDLWGHRGMTHSLLFALVVAAVFALWLKPSAKERWKVGGLLFVITASHGILDALTSGGLGVAFFSPFNLHRYFFPWRPIQVSPIGAGAFFSSRAIEVLRSEIWVWGPALALVLILPWVRQVRSRRLDAEIESKIG